MYQFVLTSQEQKRLLGKALAQIEVIKKAYQNGIIGLPLCTTNGFLIEELTGMKIEEKGRYACGIISSSNLCRVNKSLPSILIRKGEVIELRMGGLADYISDMGKNDVVVKSGNALDPDGNAACLIASPRGGILGEILSQIWYKGIKLIVPMTFNKLISFRISKLMKFMGVDKIDHADGAFSSLMPLHGEVFTPVNAIEVLTGSEAITMAAGGINRAEGATVFLAKGDSLQLKNTRKIIEEIKGEPPLRTKTYDCIKCGKTEPVICKYQNRKINELPTWLQEEKVISISRT